LTKQCVRCAALYTAATNFNSATCPENGFSNTRHSLASDLLDAKFSPATPVGHPN
jgi:hypothetical protein